MSKRDREALVQESEANGFEMVVKYVDHGGRTRV